MSPYYEDRPDEVCGLSERQRFFAWMRDEYRAGRIDEAMKRMEEYWTKRRARGAYSESDLAEFQADELAYVTGKERR